MSNEDNYWNRGMKEYLSGSPRCCGDNMELKYASHRGSTWRCSRCGETKSRDW